MGADGALWIVLAGDDRQSCGALQCAAVGCMVVSLCETAIRLGES
ncbi:MAG: hypothetical protein OEM89_08315 [Nitrosopumilus sp.]|nr:hypothetical protein [Nitrosopumilus sp.]